MALETLLPGNDDWSNAANKLAIIDSGFAPPGNLESAVLTSLNPGNYTAIVRGGSSSAGTGRLRFGFGVRE